MGQKNKPRCNTNIRKEVKVILTEELIPQVKALELKYPKNIQKGVDVELSLAGAKCLIDYIKMTEHMIDYVNVIAGLAKPIGT